MALSRMVLVIFDSSVLKGTSSGGVVGFTRSVLPTARTSRPDGPPDLARYRGRGDCLFVREALLLKLAKTRYSHQKKGFVPLLLTFLRHSTHSIGLRELRLPRRFPLGSFSESELLELLAPLELLEEGMRPLFHLLMRCFSWGLRSFSLSARYELLELPVKGVRALLRFLTVTLLRLRRSFRVFCPLLRLP